LKVKTLYKGRSPNRAKKNKVRAFYLKRNIRVRKGPMN